MEIEPNTTDVTILIEAANKKIAKWNAEMNKNMQLAQQKVAAIVAIRDRIKIDPSFLIKEREEAKKYLEEKKKEELRKLTSLAKLMVINGQIEDKDLETLKRNFKSYPETEILKIIQAKKKQQKIFKYKDDGIAELDPGLISPITKSLEIIKKKTLYEFLNLSPTSSLAELVRESNRIDADTRTYSKKTPELTAIMSLCSEAKRVFESEINRKGYNKYLQNRIFAEVDATLVDIAKNTKRVTPSQYKALLDMCLKRNIDIHHAEYYLYQTCEKRKYVIIEDGDNNTQNMASCRFCTYPNDNKQKNCISCGMPLTIICPSCKQISDSENELKCRGCGFSIGDMPNAEAQVRIANSFLTAGDINAANKYLKQAQAYWATYPALAKLEERIKEENNTITSNLAKAGDYRKNKEYVSLLAFIKTIKADNPQLNSYKAEAENAIKSATSILTKAKTLTDNAAKIDMYMQALSICSDLEEAKKELKIHPLQAPSNLKTTPVGRTIRLSWNKLASTYIKYSIVRKVNGTPQNPSDGETIAILTDSKFDDANTMPGLSYYYAVYSLCSDIYSKNAIVEGPVLTISEINNSSLRYDIQEKHINFSCKFPQNAKSIEVFRDNTLIKTLSSENFIDSGLVTEKSYTYKFVAIYEDCLGKKYRTNGIDVQLKPTAPPKAVEIKVVSTNDKSTISWANPAKGILEIYHSDKPFSENENDLINTDSFKGEKVMISGTSRVINKDFNGIKYYLPLTVSGKIGIAGRQVTITSILKPQVVSINKTNERNIDIIWKWDNGIEAIRIKNRIDGGGFMNIDIYRSQTPLPKFALSIPKNAKSIDLEVMTLFKSHSGEILLSEPITKFFNLQTAKIDFVDVRKGGFFSKNKYELTIQADTSVNSDLHLLIREGLPPSNLNNYESYLTIPAKDLLANQPVKYTVEYSRADKSKAIIFRLIPADKTQLNSIVIVPEVKQIK